MEMKLTERDYTLLNLISKTGAVNREQVHNVYGKNLSYYHLKRLKLLSKKGYVKRKKGYVLLRPKGFRAIGVRSRPLEKKDFVIKKKAQIAELYFSLEGWEIIFGAEYKSRYELYRGSRLEAVISNPLYEFAVYHLTSISPKANTTSRYLNEINVLPLKAGIDRAVIFCHPKCAEIILSKIDKPTIKELLLLPYPDGITLLKGRYNDYFFDEILSEGLPGIKRDNSLRFTDYTWTAKNGVYYISDLSTNDAIRMHYLDSYLSNKLVMKTKKKIAILCTHKKYPHIRKKYPGVPISVMTNTLDGFVPAPRKGEKHG